MIGREAMAPEKDAAEVSRTGPKMGGTPAAPFILSLVAGLLMVSGVGMMSFSYGSGYYGMMGDYYGMMSGINGGSGGWFYWVAIIGLVAGLVVLAGAVMLYLRPRSAPTWGLVILLFSVFGLFGMGGFFIGTILGIIGGVLAMTAKPEVTNG